MAKKKLTWIDIAIVLVIIISIAGVAYKFSKAKVNTPTAAKEKILVSFYMEYAPDNVVKAIKVGDPVIESVQNSSFGKVKEIVTEDSIFWESGEDGHLKASPREGFSSITLTMETEGVINQNGVAIDKSLYYVGLTTSLYVGNGSLKDGRISKITRVQE